jgi:ubiquinone/menaquinone biosynthesis C-methylase UbiE
MSYQHEHIPYYNPLDGYSRIASQYHQYHKALTKRDGNAIRQYLPRSIKWLSVLDLGWGDWRWAVQLASAWISQWTIVDATQWLLDRAPGWTNTINANLLELLPLSDALYDLMLCTFVVLHLESLENLFFEARRCIKPWWRMLLVHHYEKRPYIHDTWKEQFKIKTWHWSWNKITEALEDASREVDCFAVDNETKIFCCFPR